MDRPQKDAYHCAPVFKRLQVHRPKCPLKDPNKCQKKLMHWMLFHMYGQIFILKNVFFILFQAGRNIRDLFEDLRDGHNLLSLLEVLSGEILVSIHIIDECQSYKLAIKDTRCFFCMCKFDLGLEAKSTLTFNHSLSFYTRVVKSCSYLKGRLIVN